MGRKDLINVKSLSNTVQFGNVIYIVRIVELLNQFPIFFTNGCSKEAKSGNKELVNQVRHIGNKFLNAVEISAQEAVYLVLQMPLLINTSIPDDRGFLFKPIEKLQDMPDNSDDIESDNVIKRHQRRPNKLKNLCLADFVAWYNCIKQN